MRRRHLLLLMLPILANSCCCTRVIEVYSNALHLNPKKPMVLIFDGNSDIGSHVRSNFCYLICIMHFVRSSAVTNRILQKIPIFLHACATCSELPSNISVMQTPAVEEHEDDQILNKIENRETKAEVFAFLLKCNRTVWER